MAKKEQQTQFTSPKFKHQGKQIYLVGPAGEDGIVPFQHLFGDGHSETCALRMNTAYEVGGLDANGQIIKDWVYESYELSDMNNRRVKSKSEERLALHEAKGGVIQAKDAEFID